MCVCRILIRITYLLKRTLKQQYRIVSYRITIDIWKPEILLFVKNINQLEMQSLEKYGKLLEMNNTRWHYSVNQILKSFGIYINSKRKTKSTTGDLVTTDNYGNTVIASGS